VLPLFQKSEDWEDGASAFRGAGGPIHVERARDLDPVSAAFLDAGRSYGMPYLDDMNIPEPEGVGPFNLNVRDGVRCSPFLAYLRPVMGHHEPDTGKRITLHGQFLGTLDYVAPEQCTDPHAVDIRADIYGLGCTMYELLAGRAPFARSGYESAFLKMKAHVEAPVPPIQEARPDVPERVAIAMGRMLAKNREGRFASPADVVRAVQPFTVGADLAALAGVPAVPAA
jgi:serine/threonine protein kinase